jgi:hypothetical protein
MADLTEIPDVRQIPGEPRRRWFTADTLDLIVWCDDTGAPTGFQLAYDKPRSEHALTWTREGGLAHTAVDDGDAGALAPKATPVLVPDGHFDLDRVRRLFAAAARGVDRDVAAFVEARLATPPRTARRG